ncbi:putative DNA-binding transcriptional regulator AlpA [Methylobacterium sp. BE186]|uniref:helix-turn-helix transcriptional regulator n=1 Tax=Methylobacterium sp. BE186 TaxID=2817715 RepID=UPI00285D8D15|nr:hypothetical protein [Methylobacterium sp. BE186]MDR7037971.1 putative DNA-binding transcriptional regulator AlpA [Methylobacterium sp. BE186]
MHVTYLDNLPSDTASQIALNRIVGAAEAAAFCNISLPHWRRLYRAGKVPKPVKLSARKLGWRLGTLIEFNSGRTGEV